MENSNIRGDIRFDHVCFGYEDTDETVIHDFSADVKAGQKIAIVGPTGAGKTTMVKLLMRFHDLKSGRIYLDGKAITEFARGDLRKEFGMVLQDTWLYSGTIMENIRYGRLDATDEEVIQAAKAAQVDHFVRTLPDGYNTILNEEATNVSQGQKQLLTIARAILSDSRIMILDEATSSVDTRTELSIQTAMDNLMRGRTSFIIAHRLSTIRNAWSRVRMKNCSQKTASTPTSTTASSSTQRKARKTPVKQNEAVFSDKERTAFLVVLKIDKCLKGRLQ